MIWTVLNNVNKNKSDIIVLAIYRTGKNGWLYGEVSILFSVGRVPCQFAWLPPNKGVRISTFPSSSRNLGIVPLPLQAGLTSSLCDTGVAKWAHDENIPCHFSKTSEVVTKAQLCSSGRFYTCIIFRFQEWKLNTKSRRINK